MENSYSQMVKIVCAGKYNIYSTVKGVFFLYLYLDSESVEPPRIFKSGKIHLLLESFDFHYCYYHTCLELYCSIFFKGLP